MESECPVTGVPLLVNPPYAKLSGAVLEEAILALVKAQAQWQSSLAHRSEVLFKVAELLLTHKTILADLAATEMGKPLKEGEAEIEKCAWVCRYYAENAGEQLKDEHIASKSSRSLVTYRPLGVVFGVMPWNFPFWQVFRFAVPALMAGNTVALKHALNVPACGRIIQSVFLEASGEEVIFQNLEIENEEVETVIAHPAVASVNFTGSTRVGKIIAALAGKHLKKSILELGGSDPYLILEDADLPKAVTACLQGRLLNNGQSCIGAKRIIVVEPVAERFLALLLAEMKGYSFGNPLKEGVRLGPMARKDLREALHRQVLESIDLGAKCLLGGKIPDEKGFFYPPTLLTEITEKMPAYREELFGPVVVVLVAKNQDDAVRIANDTAFGLGAAVFSENQDEAERIAKYDLQAGSCAVNTFVRSDPRMPFGGIKQSGYGRELAAHGIREFVNVKTIQIAEK